MDTTDTEDNTLTPGTHTIWNRCYRATELDFFKIDKFRYFFYGQSRDLHSRARESVICDRDTVSDHGSERSRLVTRTTEVTHAATVPRTIVTSFWLELPEGGRLRWNATTLLESALALDWRPDSGHPAGFLKTLYWNHFSLSRDRILPEHLFTVRKSPHLGTHTAPPQWGT